MWIASTANTQAVSILPRQSAATRATGGRTTSSLIAPLHKGNARQRPGDSGGRGRAAKGARVALAGPLILFRHRSDTIGNSVVSQVLDIMVGVAGFEPATPSSRTRHPHCNIKVFWP